MLSSAPAFFEQAHLVLSASGRLILAIAAMLFLAYVLLMTAAFITSAVRGWVVALQPGQRLIEVRDRESERQRTSVARMVEQS